ncbi:MAG: rod shape-determining protein [Schwartzia sp.]|nr:rod shape-determining protein [Schwartzia sp. (in: firmicutes)]
MAIETNDAPKRTRRPKKTADAQAVKAEEAKEALFAEEAPAENAPKKRGPKKGTKRKTADEKKSAAKPKAAKKAAAKKAAPKKEHLFALDIGTRSVIGIVAEQDAKGTLKILDTTRKEHNTRAMLDGQIHDVPQVAAIIEEVKGVLEQRTGPLKSVAVAAAGRALYTMTAETEMNFSGVITAEDQSRLDFSGVQMAQTQLAESSDIDDPTHYYCVGYSTIKYTLDGIQLKSLIGQRGRQATATVIATFLPRQVIDSMDSALSETGLRLQAITLEPIAAINVLIPPTMRHLNLVLVDIGAGTSDVAITKNGSVIAYGMVPQAGDEITEAISQHFLLDFNVAERIKREAAEGKDVTFTDILGMEYHLTADEILAALLPAVQKLADAIAHQIMTLNGDEPQAVLLVGGGALTPRLAECVAEKLELPLERVAVRHPSSVDGVEALPPELMQPDAVTPLGILKIASLNTLHFLTVYVSGEEHRLFNFRELTVSDALLAAGIQLKAASGKAGAGITVTVDGEERFFPGTMGKMASVTVDGEPADLESPIASGAHIEIVPGEEGMPPTLTVGDIADVPESYTVYINGNKKTLPPAFLVNGEIVEEGRTLSDGDVITSKDTRSVGEALKSTGYPPTGKKIKYKLNGTETQFSCLPEILLNDQPTTLSTLVYEGDRIEYNLPDDPKLGEVLGLSESDTNLVIYFNGAEKIIPSARVSLELNGRPASANTIVTEGCSVSYELSERTPTEVSGALAAVGFEPPAANSGMIVEIKLNDKIAHFTDPIMNGDHLDVDIRLSDGVAAKKAQAPAPTPEPSAPAEEATAPAPTAQEAQTEGGKDGLLADYLAQVEKAEAAKAATQEPPKEPEGKDGLLAEYLALVEKEKAEAQK